MIRTRDDAYIYSLRLNRCLKVKLDIWEEEDKGKEEKEEDEVANNDKDDNDQDRKNGGCYGTKEKDETNFRCVIMALTLSAA
jgi:hypothetical protein